MHLPSPITIGMFQYFIPSPSLNEGFVFFQYVVVYEQEYWKTAKITPPIIHNCYILRHLLILVIGKELLENCLRC